MNRRRFLMTSALGTAGLAVGALAAERRRQPNFVFVFADDLGWTGLGCFGSKYYETPNIDELCAQGMKFTDGYADAPVCAPSRACLMSGQYPPRTGVFRVSDVTKGREHLCKLLQPEKRNFAPDQTTIAEALRKAGYATAHFGKWHLGPGHPSEHGFDVAIESSGKHFDFATKPPMEVPEGAYLTDFMTDRALEFVDQNKDSPFFLYLPDFLVHKPHEAKPELVERFKAKPGVGYHQDPVYAAMTHSLDQSVGRIVSSIEELGLAEDTLIIFTSDNGGRCPFGADLQPRPNAFTDNLPLRDGKGMLYEGGIRVPWIFRWKGAIEPGTVCDEPITTVDVYPTLLELAGAAPDAGHPLDGVSVAPCLRDNEASLGREALYWYYPNYSAPQPDGTWGQVPRAAIRAGEYKLIASLIDDGVELYNLRTDIGETKDLAGALPEKARELGGKLHGWMKAVGAPEMKPNPEYRGP